MDFLVPTKIVVRWRTDEDAIETLRNIFGFPKYITLNGWTPGIIKPEDKAYLDDCVKRGLLTYRKADWIYNGVTYSWE